MRKETDDKAFNAESISNVNGLQESAVASIVVPPSSLEQIAKEKLPNVDKATKDSCDVIPPPAKLTVQIVPLIEDKKPNKLSEKLLHNFQTPPASAEPVVEPVSKSAPLTVSVDNSVIDKDQDSLLSVESDHSIKMISMMTIGSNSPNSSKNSECDTFTLDSGTCSDLEVNSSSSLNSITPPPLPKKMNNKNKEKLKSSDFEENEKFFQLKSFHNHLNTSNNTNNIHHLNDQDDNLSVISCGSNNSNCSSISLISCDSLNQHNNNNNNGNISAHSSRHGSRSPSIPLQQPPQPPSGLPVLSKEGTLILNVNGPNDSSTDQVDNEICEMTIKNQKNLLPTSLLADIRNRSQNDLQRSGSKELFVKKGDRQGDALAADSEKFITKKLINFSMHSMASDDENTDSISRFSSSSTSSDFYRSGLHSTELPQKSLNFENDNYYNFHINENQLNYLVNNSKSDKCIFDSNEETFAGYKDLSGQINSGSSTIRSSKGTIRGVKNRVRNGIATFLQMQHTNIKNYKEKDAGKVVLYASSMGIVRETYAKCANVKQILRTLLVKFEERDVFMSSEYQQEIKDRMQSNEIKVPQLYVDGQYIGDAECVERLNESGELRKMLKAYKCLDPSYTCQACGGYRLLPCPSCNGSKKSVHRNHFTTEFIALKCMNCDEVGLVRCHNC